MSTSSNMTGAQRQAKRRRRERLIALGTFALIAVAWFLGSARAKADMMPAVRHALPEADHFVEQSDELFAAWGDKSEENLLGYVAIGESTGYGGPIRLAVAVDPDGIVLGVSVIDHKDTQSWYERVMKSDLVTSITGKSYQDGFEIGNDLDGVTGATYTSRGLAQAALDGSQIAAREFGMDVAKTEAPSIQFGVPEFTVLALFAVGYVGHQRKFKYKKQVRWLSMLVGLVVLGFLYNLPLTLAYFIKLILGYWPQWQTNLYWYFLLGGVIFVVTADNKNPYCEWFCPFGAAQECLALIGGAKPRNVPRFRNLFKWARRVLVLAAVLFGVYYRSPGLASYEIFGTLFGQVGSTLQFVVLGMVVVMALFVKRPWCNYLCPLDSVVEIVRVIRQWVKELWQKINPRRKTV